MDSIKNRYKRDQILGAAKSLFSRTHDYRRVSLETIAKEAGVSPATIYNTFGNRETLVYEVIKDLFSANIERSRTLIHSDLPFPQKLMSIMGSKLDMMERMNNEIIEKMMSQDERIQRLVDKIMETDIMPLWKEMMVDGKKQGYIEPALEDSLLVNYLDVLQAGFRARPELVRSLTEGRGRIEQMAHLMFYGFLKKEIDVFQKEEKRPYG